MLSRAEQASLARPFWIVAGCLAWALLVYWPTTWSMIQIWHRSETFAHGFIVIPIFLWLVWDRRSEFARVVQGQNWLAAIGVLAAVIFWLLAELSAAIAPAQFAVILMVPLLVLLLLGSRALGRLAFPMFVLFFAVPFGEFLVPRMMDWTADFTVAAVRMSGVPVYREGNEFVIPSGRWSVIEACAGLRYLIASTMIGVVFAVLTYRSLLRRAAFMVAAVIVPIVANWLRAYVIVMLGHLSDNAIASGVDHIIYGWIFFGLVMALLFWVGSLWREVEKPSKESGAMTALLPGRATNSALPASVLLLAAGLTLLGPALLWMTTRAGPAGSVAIPAIAGAKGWEESAGALPEWRPDLMGPNADRSQVFVKNGRGVGVYIAAYVDQRQGSELVNQMNELARSRNPTWRRIAHGERPIALDSKQSVVNTAVLKGRSGDLLVWQWYWVAGRIVTSDIEAKAMLALSKLFVRCDASAWVAIYTETELDERAASARLQQFLDEMGSELTRSLELTTAQ